MSKEKDFIEKSFEEMTEDERLKYEIAVELGLADKVKEEGWKAISARVPGRIDRLMTKRKKQKALEAED